MRIRLCLFIDFLFNFSFVASTEKISQESYMPRLMKDIHGVSVFSAAYLKRLWQQYRCLRENKIPAI